MGCLHNQGQSFVLASAIATTIQSSVTVIFNCLNSCLCFYADSVSLELQVPTYTPIVVSIGPYHRMDERLRSMEPIKLEYLESFKLQSGERVHHSSLLSCVEKIIEEEDWIRKSYADPISIPSDDFIRMVLIDSFFVIQFLSRHSIPTDENNRPTAFEEVQFVDIKQDLPLLENQLPFFILDKIYNICYGAFGTLKFIVAKFFEIHSIPHVENCDHLLNAVRNQYVSNFHSIPNEKGELQHMVSPTVSHLLGAGVMLKVAYSTQYLRNTGKHEVRVKSQNGLVIRNKGEEIAQDYGKSLLEIQFDKDKGVLTIPMLIVAGPTQSLFRNMIALEQCMYLLKKPTFVTDYFYFMDSLIITPEDVQLLADEGIVENWLGSEVVCEMFNTISNNAQIVPWDYAYSGLSEKLNNHCNKKWNRYKATLRNNYFAHPWAYISVAYAVVYLLLTIAQVILAILALPGVL